MEQHEEQGSRAENSEPVWYWRSSCWLWSPVVLGRKSTVTCMLSPTLRVPAEGSTENGLWGEEHRYINKCTRACK